MTRPFTARWTRKHARWLSASIGLLVACAAPAAAMAQTADDAGKFFDQTAVNGATKIVYDFFADTSHYTDSAKLPATSTTARCTSRIAVDASVVTIDWSKVVGEKHGDEVIQLVGGVTYGEVGEPPRVNATPGLLVKTFSPEMNLRLLKAVGIIIKSCAKPSYGL